MLRTILNEKRLIGGKAMIRGGYRCVCFTEAPFDQLRAGLSWSISRYNKSENRRFQPYGILFGKGYLFDIGGRPVIYQSHDEYDALPEALRYRHVKYEPNANPPVDFTWEREWRLHTDELRLDPENCTVLVQTDAEREEMANMWFPEEKVPWIVLTPDQVTAKKTPRSN
ncbi:MAG TPA: hypothetical protein VFS56_03350 [Gemmatimonadaceae bacterium]|nr:hypothetical protein [Gemmatimonadaceae bacterium]